MDDIYFPRNDFFSRRFKHKMGPEPIVIHGVLTFMVTDTIIIIESFIIAECAVVNYCWFF